MTAEPATTPTRARTMRIVRILLITILVELGLRLLAWRSPAYAPLARPVYLLVLAAATYWLWHVFRRRQSDRRHASRRKS